jgi:hypothetical protein
MAWCFAALLPKVSKSEWAKVKRFGGQQFAMKNSFGCRSFFIASLFHGLATGQLVL